MVYTRDRGLGLSPGPVRAPTFNIFQFKYNIHHIYNKAYMVGVPVGWPFPSLFPCPEVAGSTPANNIILNQCICDTWWPLIGPRVTIPFAANMPHHMPTVHTTACHVSYGLPRQRLYGLYSQHPFFCLFVILNRT
jgi:hypothetical protein